MDTNDNIYQTILVFLQRQKEKNKVSKIKNETNSLLAMIRQGKPMTGRQQLWLTVQLSVPAIVAQLSSILMQYIDASMVGSLGANASASIGLVSTTTWLFWGVCSAAATGFSVQVAHLIGAGDMERARAVLRQSIVSVFVFSRTDFFGFIGFPVGWEEIRLYGAILRCTFSFFRFSCLCCN